MSEQRRRKRVRRAGTGESANNDGIHNMSDHGWEPDPYDEYAAYDKPSRRGKRRLGGQPRRQTSRSGTAQWVRRVLLGLLAVLLLLILYKGVRLGMLGFRLNQQANNIQALASNGVGESTEAITSELQGVATTLNSLAGELGPIQPLLNKLNDVTSVGTTLANASELTDVGSELTVMALQGLSVGQPLLQERQSESFPTALAEVMANSTETLVDLGNRADALTPRVEALGDAGLLPILEEPLRQGGATMGFGSALLKLAPVLPQLMGTERPGTYLILIQNNHELRATGGFITAVGQLTLDKGEIVALDFRDSYEIVNHDVEHPWAPEPMQRFLGIGLMFLRDTNWSPDLPTASQLIRTIYGLNEGVRVDGIITLDLNGVQLMMEGLGQLRVQGVDRPITSENIVEQIKLFWQDAPEIESGDQETTGTNSADTGGRDTRGEDSGGEGWWKHRKDFMPFLGEAAIEKIQGGAVDYLALIQALHTALEQRSIQLWVNDDDVALRLAALDWDGAMRPPQDDASGLPSAQDFIGLVDSNFGFNKVDSVLERTMHYQVEWPSELSDSGQPAMAITSITYKHPLIVDGHLCDVTPRYGATYDDMASRCYFDYVRLYVPIGSRLREVEGVDLTTTDSQPGENGTQVFSAYFITKPGQAHTIRFHYELPVRIQKEGYQLAVRRQSGTQPLPFNALIGTTDITPISIATEIHKGSYHWP